MLRRRESFFLSCFLAACGELLRYFCFTITLMVFEDLSWIWVT